MKISTGLFILSSIYLICTNQFANVWATSSVSNPNLENRRQRTRPSFVRVPLGRPPVQYARVKSEPFNDFLDDDDLFELSKRQTSDDYGHLRFGKRGEDSFDDYGHMRFGRSGND